MPTNPYYQASGQPVAISRASSSIIRTEYGAIQSGFDAVSNAVTAKGAIAGQAWSGTHNFPATTYGVTAEFGATGTAYATLDFVNAVAINSGLPGQAGNAGKIPITNGTTVSWSGLLNTGVIRFADGTDQTKQLALSLSGIATATTRTVTVPNKSGTLAMTSDIGLVLLATITPTAAATVDFLSTFTSAYDNYRIIISGVKPSSNDSLKLRLANAGVTDSGSNYIEGDLANGVGTTVTTTATSGTLTGAVLAAGQGGNVVIDIVNVNDITGIKSISAYGTAQTDATPGYFSSGKSNAYIAANSVSGGRLFWNAGAVFAAQGKVRIYGYQNS